MMEQQPARVREGIPGTHQPSADSVARDGLRADIQLLDGVLGDAIRRLAGDEAFALQAEVRAAAGALRAEPSLCRSSTSGLWPKRSRTRPGAALSTRTESPVSGST